MTTAFQLSLDASESFRSVAIKPKSARGRLVITAYHVSKSNDFFSSIRTEDLINYSKADQLISQARALRRSLFWFLSRFHLPSRKVINAAISVINYCPSELLLEGFSVVNYGDGTVALIQRSNSSMTTINIGSKALSFAKLRVADHSVVASGSRIIERGGVAAMFQELFQL